MGTQRGLYGPCDGGYQGSPGWWADQFTALTMLVDLLQAAVDSAAQDSDVTAEAAARAAGDAAEATARSAAIAALSGTYVQSAIATETPGATVTLDLSDGKTRRYLTLEDDTTLAVDNDDAQPLFIVIVDTGAGGFDLTFWSGIQWATTGGTAPTVTPEADARDVFSFIKLGVADYLGFVVGQGLAIPVPPAAPDVPTSIVATAGNTTADVAFTPGSNGGAARDGCRITPYIGSTAQTPQVFSTTATTQTVTGLTNGVAYTFKVEDHNSVGYSSPLSAASNSVTPSATAVPGAPTSVVIVAGDGQLDSVSWTAGPANGSTITDATIKVYRDSDDVLLLTTTVGSATPSKSNVGPLTNGVTVYVKVNEVNGVGPGAQSSKSNTDTPTAAAFSPTSVAGLVRWGDPEPLAAGALASYPDSSGASTTLTQATSGKRPVVTAGVLSGKNVLRFTPADQCHMVSATFGAVKTQPTTAVMVAKCRVVPLVGEQKLIDGTGTDRNAITSSVHGISGNSTWTTYAGAGGGGNGFGEPGAAWNIIVVQFNGASTTGWINGGTGVVLSTEGTAGQGRIVLGCDQGLGAHFFDGDMADDMFFDALVSKADLNLLGAWLVAKYPALTWNTIP